MVMRTSARLGYRSPSKRPGGAIVTPVAGTTRDRRECIGRIGGTTFRLVDTAGVDGEKIDVAFGELCEENHLIKFHLVMECFAILN